MSLRQMILDKLSECELTQRSLCLSISRPEKWLTAILTGKKRLTADSALDLELALGISAESLLEAQLKEELAEARAHYGKVLLMAPQKPKFPVKSKLNVLKSSIISEYRSGKSIQSISDEFELKANSVWTALVRWGEIHD